MKANKRTSISTSSLLGFTDDRTDKDKELKNSLTSFLVALIEMDRQNKEWLASKAAQDE